MLVASIRTNLFRVISLAILAVLVLFQPLRVDAFSWLGEHREPREEFEWADLVIVGRVVDHKEQRMNVGGASNIPQNTFKFRVLRSWKGTNKPLVTVSTSDWRSQGGFHFLPGKEYLVYANQAEGDFFTSVMARNGLASRPSVQREVRLLDRMTLGTEKTWPRPKADVRYVTELRVAATVAVVVLVLLLGLLVWSRHRRVSHRVWLTIFAVFAASIVALLAWNGSVSRLESRSGRLVMKSGMRLFDDVLGSQVIDSGFAANQLRPGRLELMADRYYIGPSWMDDLVASLRPEAQILPYYYVGSHARSLKVLEAAIREDPLRVADSIQQNDSRVMIHLLAKLDKLYPLRVSRVISDLREALLEDNPPEQAAMLGLLDQLLVAGSSSAREQLVEFMSDDRPDTAVHAATILLARERAVDPQAKRLVLDNFDSVLLGASSVGSLQEIAALTLSARADSAGWELPLDRIGPDHVQDSAVAALIKSEEKLPRDVVKLLGRRPSVFEKNALEYREDLIGALCDLHPREAEEIAATFLKSGDLTLGVLMLATLGKPVPPGTLGALSTRLEDGSPHFEFYAANHLELLIEEDQQAANDVLVRLLSDKEVRERRGVREFLASVDVTLAPEVIQLSRGLAVDENYIQFLAKQAKLGVPGARDGLEELRRSGNQKHEILARSALSTLDGVFSPNDLDKLATAVQNQKLSKRLRSVAYTAYLGRAEPTAKVKAPENFLQPGLAWRSSLPLSTEQRRGLAERFLRAAKTTRNPSIAQEMCDAVLALDRDIGGQVWPDLLTGQISLRIDGRPYVRDNLSPSVKRSDTTVFPTDFDDQDLLLTDTPDSPYDLDTYSFALLAYLRQVDDPASYLLRLLDGDVAVENELTVASDPGIRHALTKAAGIAMMGETPSAYSRERWEAAESLMDPRIEMYTISSGSRVAASLRKVAHNRNRGMLVRLIAGRASLADPSSMLESLR